jgi:hypothetical protein
VFCASLRSAQHKNWCFPIVRAKARTYLKSKDNSKCEKQIPPLRCGMTTKEQATAKKRQRQKQVQLNQAVAS